MLSRKDIQSTMIVVAIALVSARVAAQTPKLNIRTKHGIPMEEQRREQMERLARQYDLKKFTVTRDIMAERGAMNHSHPLLTLSLRFLGKDARAAGTPRRVDNCESKTRGGKFA